MATKEVLQPGRTVKIDSKGNRTYGPMPRMEDDGPTAKTLGSGAAAQAAQQLLDARARREAEAGYKRGGKVVAKKPAAKKTVKRK